MSHVDVHIIDGDHAVRQGLGGLLATAGLLARAYPSVIDFLEVAERVGVCCIVAELRADGMDGLDLIQWLGRRGLARPVIVTSSHASVTIAVEAMRAGARDFIEKPFGDAIMLAAVRGVLRPDVRAAGSDGGGRMGDLLSTLSPREQAVLRAVVAGQANKIIASELGISPRTVEAHRAHVMAKTGATSRRALVRMAVQAGL